MCNGSDLEVLLQPLCLNNIIKQSKYSLIVIHLSSCKAHLRSNHLKLYLVRSKKMMEGIGNGTIVC